MSGFGISTVEGLSGAELAVLREDRVQPLHGLVPDAPTHFRALLDDWARWCNAIERALDRDDQGPWQSIDEAVFQPPLPDPPTIYGIAANYVDHAVEMNDVPYDKKSEPPYYFLLPPAALTGHRGEVRRPVGVQMLDWEVELAAVIGKRASSVSTADALACIAGYTLANDISARDAGRHDSFGVRWLPMKGCDTFVPMGPSIVPACYIDDPMNLDLSLTVNGDTRQSSNTSRMIFSLQEQIALLSQTTTLLPGDIVLTGTPHGTAAAYGTFLSPGDRVSAHIEALGTLENVVVDGAQPPEPVE